MASLCDDLSTYVSSNTSLLAPPLPPATEDVILNSFPALPFPPSACWLLSPLPHTSICLCEAIASALSADPATGPDFNHRSHRLQHVLNQRKRGPHSRPTQAFKRKSFSASPALQHRVSTWGLMTRSMLFPFTRTP